VAALYSCLERRIAALEILCMEVSISLSSESTDVQGRQNHET